MAPAQHRACSACLLSNTCFFLSQPQSEAVERMRCGEAGRNVKFMQDALLRIRAAMQSGLPCEKSEQKSRWISSLCLRNFGGSNPLDESTRSRLFRCDSALFPQQRRQHRVPVATHTHTHAQTLVNTHAPPHTPCANWHAATHRCGFKLAFSFQSQAARLYKHTHRSLSGSLIQIKSGVISYTPAVLRVLSLSLELKQQVLTF